MVSVTVERIAMVQAHILDATLKTSGGSALPAGGQHQMLAQSCAEACDLLGDWIGSGWFGQRGPAGAVPLAEAAPTAEQFTEFLGPIFADARARWREVMPGGPDGGISVPALQEARATVAALARRHRRMTRGDLFRAAEERTGRLRDEVCRTAAELARLPADGSAAGPEGAAWRQRARRVLAKVAAFLPTVAVAVAGAMLGAGPHEMAHSVSEWAHEAAAVVTVYHLADLAQPGVRITPRSAGPRVH